MPRDEGSFTYQIPNFLAGVHTCPDYRNRPANSMTKAKNAVLSRCGYVTRRLGMDMIGDADPDLATTFNIGIAVWDVSHYDSAGDDGYLALRQIGTNLKVLYIEDHTVGWVNPTQTDPPIDISLNKNNLQDVDGVLFFTNGGKVGKYDPSTNSVSYIYPVTSADPPTDAPRQTYFKDRNWYVKTGGLIYFSKIGDGDLLERDLDVIRIKDEIYDIIPWRDSSLVVFTENTIYELIVGSSPTLLDWSLNQITTNIGQNRYGMACSVFDDIFFLSPNFRVHSIKSVIQSLSAGVEPIPVSHPITNAIEAFNRGYPNYGATVFHDGHYYIAGNIIEENGGNGDYSSSMYTFSTLYRAWTGPHTIYAAAAADDYGALIYTLSDLPEVPDLTDKIFIGRNLHASCWIEDATDGNAVRYMRQARDGAFVTFEPSYSYVDSIETQTKTVRFEIITRPQDFDFPQQEKTLKWVEVEFGDEDVAFSANGSFTFYAKTIEGSSWTSFGTASYTTSDKFMKAKFPGLQSLGRSKVFQFRIVDDSASDGPKIRGMWINGFGEDIKGDR